MSFKQKNVNIVAPFNLSFSQFERNGLDYIRDGMLFETTSGLAFNLSDNTNLKEGRNDGAFSYLCLKQEPVSSLYTGVAVFSDIEALQEQQKKDNFLTFIKLDDLNINNDIILFPEENPVAKLEPNFEDLARPIVRVKSGYAVQIEGQERKPYMFTKTDTFSSSFQEYFILNTQDQLKIIKASNDIERNTQPLCYVNVLNNEIIDFS